MNSSTSPTFKGQADAIRNMGGNIDRYYKYLNRFCTTYRNSPKEIEELLIRSNIPEAHRLVHSVKGLAATLGLTDLYYAAGNLENSIKSDTGIPASLRTYCDALDEILNKDR